MRAASQPDADIDAADTSGTTSWRAKQKLFTRPKGVVC